jgi:hypothetical protein
MRNYREMSPCERVNYYRREIRRMTPPTTERDRLLLETFRQLLMENEPLCDWPQPQDSSQGR